MVGCCVSSPAVPRHKVSLLRAGKDVPLSTAFPSAITATHRTSLALENCQRASITRRASSFLNKPFLDTWMPAVPSIKIFMDNLNNYLNYTGRLDLGNILKMFLPLLCLQFLSTRNTDIYPKTQDFTDLGSIPLSFWNDFPFCHLMLCTTSHAGKSIFQDIFCLRKISCLLATLRVISALLEVQSRCSNR